MDKDLHNDIGDFFRDGIEPLNEPPRKQVWENLEQQLNKHAAEKYKQKFVVFRRVASVLLFLLLGTAVFTVIYISSSNKGRGGINSITSNSSAEIKNGQPLKNNSAQQNDYINSGDSPAVITRKDNENRIADSLTKMDDIRIATEEKRKRNNPLNKSENQKRKVVGRYAGQKDLSINETQHLSFRLKSSEPVIVQTISEEYDRTRIKIPVLNFGIIAINDTPTGMVENKPASKRKNNNNSVTRFSVTAYAAPETAGYILEDDEINQYDNKQVIEKRETQDLSISSGILIGYDVNDRLNLQSGIIYSSSNISIDPSKIYAEATYGGDIKYRYNTSSGYSYILPSFSTSPAIGDSLLTRTSEHNLQQLSIPVMAKYRFGNKKLSFGPAAGVAFNFLTRATLNTEVTNSLNQEDESLTKLEGLKKVSYSMLIIPEFQYKVSRTWTLSAMPFFKYALVPFNKGNIVKTYPYTIGLGIGAVYRF